MLLSAGWYQVTEYPSRIANTHYNFPVGTSNQLVSGNECDRSRATCDRTITIVVVYLNAVLNNLAFFNIIHSTSNFTFP